MQLPSYPEDPELAAPATWRDQNPADGFGNLELLSQRCAEHQVIDELPQSAAAAADDNYQHRARVIGERLWLLGYLPGTATQARELFARDAAAFRLAVTRFQQDIWLLGDAWAGPRTWHALERLVKFEGGTLPTAWMAADSWPPALLRAAQLRLATLGFGTNPPGPDFTGPDLSAIATCRQVLRGLGLLAGDPAPQLDAATLVLLLDQDGLLDAVAARCTPGTGHQPGSFRYLRVPGWDRREMHQQMAVFLQRMARIELWLLGMEVDIVAPDDFPVLGFDQPMSAQRARHHPLGKALLDFHLNLQGLHLRHARLLSGAVNPTLFVALATQQAQTSGAEVTEAETYQAVADQVQGQDDVDRALERGRSLGMRVWDGLKRLARWFLGRVRKILDIGWNLARVFFRYASKSFQILRRAIRAVTESLEAWASGLLPADPVLVLVRRDLDLQVLGNGVDAAGAAQATTRLRLFGQRMLFAARVLALVFGAMVQGALNQWARFAQVLVRQLADLLPLYREIQRAEVALA